MPRKIIQLMGYANDANGDAKYALCDDGTVWAREHVMDTAAASMLDVKRWGWVQIDTSDITAVAKPNVTTIQAVATDTTRLDWLLRNTRVCQDWKWTGNNHPKYGNLNDLDTREDIDRAIMEEMVRG